MQDNQTPQRHHVLLIYRKMIPSIRLCGHCQLESLAARGVIEYRAIQELQLTDADMDWAEVVVIGRLDGEFEYQLTKRFYNTGRYIIYILDDDLLNISPNVSSAPHYSKPEVRAQILGMIGMSDAILSPSPLLLEKYATDGRAGLLTEEPALDPIPFRPHDPAQPIRIGFAGSIDRTSDLERMLKEALTRVKDEYGDRVSFEFFGARPDYASDLDAKYIPYTDSYDAYRQTLNESAWDVGLAPLSSSEFNACKHYNKFCEYAAAGIAGIYSDCSPYTRIPERERHGRFCSDFSEDWYEQICSAIEDRDAWEAYRERCSEYARDKLCVDGIADALWEDLSPLVKDLRPQSMLGESVEEIIPRVTALDRVKGAVRKYGIRTPLVAIRKVWVRILAERHVQRVLNAFRKYGVRTPLVAIRKLYERISG